MRMMKIGLEVYLHLHQFDMQRDIQEATHKKIFGLKIRMDNKDLGKRLFK